MGQIACDETLEQAFCWLCRKREHYSPNSDVWDIRRQWDSIKPTLQQRLLKGTYQLSPQQEIRLEQDTLELWSSLDAVVLKALTLVLTRHLKPHISPHCFHVQGNGGAKKALSKVQSLLKDNAFVFRTDVKGYYASIDHHILFTQLETYIEDGRVLALLWEYLRRTIHYGGLYWDIKGGLSLGCPLSPLMGALYLKVLDERMEKTGLDYVRFMDDWVVLAPTRWKLKAAVRIVNQTLAELKLEKHPDKTFIGRIDKGFDFPGYKFGPAGLSLAPKTHLNFVGRIAQLYEQGADQTRIGQYVQHWFTRATTGVSLEVTWIDPLLKQLPLWFRSTVRRFLHDLPCVALSN